MAPLCRFYQQGHCRNGASCRFEHPGANSNSNPFGAPTGNRFNALNNAPTRPHESTTNPYKLTKDSIKTDLADERPTWIFSCYGPGRDAPEQLFGGYPREQSLEEVMLHVRKSPNQQQALAEVTALHNQAEQQIQTILGNLDGAIEFVLAAENNHPNRIDICKQGTIGGGATGVFASNPLSSNGNANHNPFSTAQPNNQFGGGGGGGAAPAFGQPSTMGQKPNPFGSAPTSQFGQPSQMGAAGPAFGQPSQMGASASAFGQPSQMGASGPAFGQPSTMGQRPNPFAAAAAGPSGFAQAAQSTFGQPSALGQKPNPFGAPATSSASPFGAQSSVPSGANPFGQGQAANSSTSPFGQPAASSPFAQPAASKDLSMDTSAPEPAPSNPFGQPQISNKNSGAQANNPFGQPAGGFAQAAANPFASAAAAPAAQTRPAPAQSGTGPYAPGSTKQHPPPESYISKTMNGQLTVFQGQPVVYKWKVNDRYQDAAPPDTSTGPPVPGIRKPDGSWRKILFPAGPPPYNKDTEPDPAEYDATVKAAYAQMAATGRFEGGIPEVPPMREDCVWLF